MIALPNGGVNPGRNLQARHWFPVEFETSFNLVTELSSVTDQA